MEKWGKIQEAVEYYGVATHTIHVWRRQGKLKSRPAPTGNRVGYEYQLDPEFKEFIEMSKQFDKRWG